ncbi:hypothetical protein J7I98_14630 [Streptomyces sp. ISL-98]|nr:hypothetical protein [Streptomyces sp. ISL-98]MBT2507101.1 hypothetical protein [Streptomyces sp. ISL-98]
MSASEREAPQPHPQPVSMRDLLASCAAASAVSTPPREPDEKAEAAGPVEKRVPGRDAAQDAA